jgi:hypothetical protein
MPSLDGVEPNFDTKRGEITECRVRMKTFSTTL